MKDVVKDFVENIFVDNEKDLVKDFIEDIFNEYENEVKDTVKDFIGNIVEEAQNEELIEENKFYLNKNENVLNETNNKYSKGKNNNIIEEKNSNNQNNENNYIRPSNQNKNDNIPINSIINAKVNINNLIKSEDLLNISNVLNSHISQTNNLHQSQEFPDTQIIHTKYNFFPYNNKDFIKNYIRKNSIRREYQRRMQNPLFSENFQIIYDNSREKDNSLIINKNNENIFTQKNALNALSKIKNFSNIKIKLKNILLKEPIKKLKFQKNIKYYFKKWKLILRKKKYIIKYNTNIINNNIYKSIPNEDNEMIDKLPKKIKTLQKEHFYNYNSNLKICYPINIIIHNGIFYLNKNLRNEL